jgi:TATA-box binding protein (TBP) (component of TFIID and TFIIIB)
MNIILDMELQKHIWNLCILTGVHLHTAVKVKILRKYPNLPLLNFFVQMITMKLRKPYTTASMWSSGKVTCTGATSEEQAKIAARRFARCLQKLGFKARFNNFRVVNVLGTCSMPFAIKIMAFSERYKENAE